MNGKDLKKKAVIIRDNSLEEKLIKLKKENFVISDNNLEEKSNMNLKEKVALLEKIMMLQEKVLDLRKENLALLKEINELRHPYYGRTWTGDPVLLDDYCHIKDYADYGNGTVFNDNWDKIYYD